MAWTLTLLFLVIIGFVVVLSARSSGLVAVSRVLVSLDRLEPDEAIDQFDALDESNAMTTIVDVFASDDLWARALTDAGIPEDHLDSYARAVENPSDSLIVTIEVMGPDGRVTPLADSVAGLGATDLEVAFPEIVVVSIDSLRAEPVSSLDLVLAALVGLAAFVTVSLAIIGPIVGNGSSDAKRSLRNSVADWINDGAPRESERTEWPPLRLVLTIGILGLLAGTFASSALLGLAAVVGAVAAMALLFALRHPQWLTVGLVLLVLFRLSDIATDFFGAPELSIPYALFVLAVIGIRKLVFGEIRDGWLGMAIALAALVAIMSLSGLQAADQTIALDRTFDVAKNGLVALMMVILVRELRDLRTVVWTLIGGTAFLSALGVFSYFAGSVPDMLEGFAQMVEEVVDGEVISVRIAGPIGDANFFGQLLVTIFPLAFERAWRERSTGLRVAAGATALLIAGAIVLTNSRGAMIGLVACFILLLFWLKPPATVLVVAAFALAIVPFVVPATYFERIGSVGQVFSVASGTSSVDPSIQGRTSELVVGIEMFHDHPLLGVGPGNYPARYIEYSPDVGLDYRAELRQPHSLPVEVAAELGLLGLTWWFLAVVVFGRSLWRTTKSARLFGDTEMANYLEALTIALIGFMVTALFLHLDFARFFWMIAGTTAAAIRLAKARVQARAPERELVPR